MPTPAGAPVSTPLPYAGFWVRFVAFLIDGVILGIPFFLVAIGLIFRLRIFGLLARRGRFGPPDAALMGPVILGLFFAFAIFIVVRWLYFAGMESSARQSRKRAIRAFRRSNASGGTEAGVVSKAKSGKLCRTASRRHHACGG